MKSNKIIKFLGLCFLIMSCNKGKFLDAKPDASLITPETLKELQAVLDNTSILNGNSDAQIGIIPAFGELGADNLFLTAQGESFVASRPIYLNLYTWDDNIYIPLTFYEWQYPYRAILYSNIALEGLSKIDYDESQRPLYNNIKGSAHFFRGQMLYHLAQIFCEQYENETAQDKLGLVLKNKADINENVNRSNLKETYDRILLDLKEAFQYLPNEPLDDLKTRPSRQAAAGLIARTYLSMKMYDSAYEYAKNCLELNNELIDYNTIDFGLQFPFERYNKEVILHSCLIQTNVDFFFSEGFCGVDSNLVNSFDENDLRKAAFLTQMPTGEYYFKGSYDGSPIPFGGLAVDEMYLIIAESSARMGNLQEACSYLDVLCQNRYSSATYIPYISSNQDSVIEKVLLERRKELLLRGLRFSDIKRANSDGAAISIIRHINGSQFVLDSHSPKFSYLLPPEVVTVHPEMKQNPR